MRPLQAAPRLWREALPRPAAASHALDIPLVPSPLARRAFAVLLAAQLLHAIELLLLQHLVMAGAVLAVAVVLGLGRRRAMRTSAATPRRLLLLADGRLCLLLAGGAVEPATLLPQSLRLGAWLLLVLRSGTATHRLLIGPDNLAAGPLATLRRRLGATTQASVPGFMSASPLPPASPR